MSTRTFILALPYALAGLAWICAIRPARLRVRAQAIWAMVLLFCASRGIVYEGFGGDAQAPELPEALLWFWDWALAGLFVFTPLSLVWWVRRGRLIVLALLSWGLAAIGSFNAILPPQVRTVELSYADLPRELDGYRLVQISDLHCSPSARGWRTRRVVDRVNALAADLICVTGDLEDGHVACVGPFLEPITELRARDGVYCVKGNHEYYIDKYVWPSWYRQKGVRFLMNECVFPRARLALGGVPDIRAYRYGDPRPNVAKAFRAATNGEFRVLMEHRPIHARANLSKHGVRLQLSGHTHGGIAPFVSRLVAKSNGGFVRGLYRLGRGWLYVSPGAGQWAGFPIRLFNPSEVTLFVLRRAAEKDAAGGAS